MDIVPCKSVGIFRVGDAFREVIRALRGLEKDQAFKHVDVVFREEDPLGADLEVRLFDGGMRLLFDPSAQRLKIIEVCDLKLVELSYSGTVFSGPKVNPSCPTFSELCRLFGPTYPGSYEDQLGSYVLHYPGLSFLFPSPHMDGKTMDRVEDTDLPLQNPDGTSAQATSLFIYGGTNINKAPLPSPNKTSGRSDPFEKMVVCLGQGVRLLQSDRLLRFGATAQDVLAVLGPCDKTFFKGVDKLRIYRTSDAGLPPANHGCRDYFWNYFSLGMDVLFDGRTHTIKKFILHTNFPGHYDFNDYVKCDFLVLGPSEKQVSWTDRSEYNDVDGVVVADSRWADVEAVFGDAGTPVVHTMPAKSSPFPSTLFYGYRNIIFEVMKNQHIASVTLFADER